MKYCMAEERGKKKSTGVGARAGNNENQVNKRIMLSVVIKQSFGNGNNATEYNALI